MHLGLNAGKSAGPIPEWDGSSRERTDPMNLAASADLYGYWNALRCGGAAPERGDIDPGALRAVLADTFLLALDAPNFPFRIAGSRAGALFAGELRGRSFLEIWREADRERVKLVLQRVAQDAQPYILTAATSIRASPIEVEATLLPLRQGQSHCRLLGSLAAHQSPQGLGFATVGLLSLISADRLFT